MSDLEQHRIQRRARVNDLADANSHHRALLDMAASDLAGPPSPPLGSTLSRAQDSPPEESRRTKRRKLDSDQLGPRFDGFRYGRLGQVEEGQLKMEIASCDGGIYADTVFPDGRSYKAENILKHDESVYCTKGNRCNIILQHQGATTFTLTELVIKAPSANFSAP